MMHISVCPSPESLGYHAALETADIIRKAIEKDGEARIILSTGASQFTTLDALVKMPDIDWNKVEMFHLDEYVNLPETHIASFRKYLKERFVSKINLGKAHFVDGTAACIQELGKELDRAPIHVGLIGIGQNAHIAFNDPPADFDTDAPYLIVNLDDTCKKQQVHEGWFATTDDVPKQAVSMSVNRIMRCQRIISAVPYAEKAGAIRKTLMNPLSNMIPATILKTHAKFSLYVDTHSFYETEIRKILTADSDESYLLQVFTK